MPDYFAERIYYQLPCWAQDFIFSCYGLRLRRQRYNKHFYRYLENLIQSQWWTKEEIRDFQNRKLQQLIKHANATIPFYREWFGDHGVRVEKIKAAEDLEALPILTKSIARENQERMVSSRFRRRDLITVLTSGTTGTPLQIATTKKALAFQWALWWRHRSRFGLNVNDKFLMFGARIPISQNQKKPPFWRHDLANNRTYLSSYHLTKDNMFAIVDYLNSTNFTFFAGYPSAMLILANHILDTGQELTNRPKIVVTGSDALHPGFAARISQAFGAPITEQYGMMEFAGNLSKCKEGLFHVDFECGCVETKATEDDRKLVRLLLTGWGNMAMPFIHYDVGDLAKPHEGTCGCGLHSECFESINGRSEDYIVTPDGRAIMGMNQVFEYAHGAEEIQIRQNNVRSIQVCIVPSSHYSDNDQEALTRELRRRIGADMKIEFLFVDNIPRTNSGKFKAVISEIQGPAP